ncbi:hypothetical protein [Tissierella sp.]|uniref:TDE2712 family protein n=1 Tax=Tissierella sp. TaxID=41274 RepID=UPI00285C4D05|nr:hypothetical protein [Tissierella sp.]MDR7855849.1 hypothetical protein [Tissierella sp.]
MINTIKINFDVVEMMLFIWQSVAEREKISETFMLEVANKKEMDYLYDEEFSKESVRKVLSAISNRELLNHPTKKESRFWNNNMWMLEDLDNMNNMVKPVKTLNLDHLKEKLDNAKFNDVEIIFIPGHVDEYIIDENKLVVNFFKIMVNPMESTDVKILGKPLKEYIEEKVLEMVK